MRLDVVITVLAVETVLVVALTVAWLEAGLERAEDLVETMGRQGLELVLFVDLVDWDVAVHLQTMQEEQKFRELLGLLVLTLLTVA